MRIYSTFFIFIALTFLLGFSCEGENENILPSETSSGKNTFGCIIDGKIWRNKGQTCFGCSNTFVEVYSKFNEFRIVGTNTTDTINQGIAIVVKSKLQIGTYYFNSTRCYAKFSQEETNCFYQTDSTTNSGILEITKVDQTSKIVSGRFRFTANKYTIAGIEPTGDCKSNVTITDGRFDIIYSNY